MATKPETRDRPADLADYLSRHKSSPEPIKLSHQRNRKGILSITTGRNVIGLNGQSRPAEILIDETQISAREAIRALQRVRHGTYTPKSLYAGGSEAAVVQTRLYLESQKIVKHFAFKIARPKAREVQPIEKPCTSQIDAMRAAIIMRNQTKDRAIFVPAAATDRVAISPWKPWTLTITQIVQGKDRLPIPTTIKRQLDYFIADVCISSMLPRVNTVRRLRKWVDSHISNKEDVFEYDMLRPNNVGVHILKLISLFREWRCHPEYHHTDEMRQAVCGRDGINHTLFKGHKPDLTPLQQYRRKMPSGLKIFTDKLNEISTIFEVIFVTTKKDLVA